MKSRKINSPDPETKARIARLQRQMAAARKQAEKLRAAARKAKAELKRVRKAFKQAKRAAKLARKKTKTWEKMLVAAKEVVSAAKSRPASPVAAKPKAKPSKRHSPLRRSTRTRSAPSEIASTSLSLNEQYSSGAKLGGTDQPAPAPAPGTDQPVNETPPAAPPAV